MDDTTLAAAFPAATEAQWRALVDGVLKGADFEKRLVRRTPTASRFSRSIRRPRPRPSPDAPRRGAGG